MNNWKKINDTTYRFHVEVKNTGEARLRIAKVIRFAQPPSKSELLETAAIFEETTRAEHHNKELKPDGELDTARGE